MKTQHLSLLVGALALTAAAATANAGVTVGIGIAPFGYGYPYPPGVYQPGPYYGAPPVVYLGGGGWGGWRGRDAYRPGHRGGPRDGRPR
jgi:hypothetical protein